MTNEAAASVGPVLASHARGTPSSSSAKAKATDAIGPHHNLLIIAAVRYMIVNLSQICNCSL